MQQLPLSAAFSKAYTLHSKHSLSSEHSQELLELLQHCEQLVEQGALFSRNEDQDDLSTGLMRYLLVPFMKAEALNTAALPQQPQQQQQATMAQQRLQQASAARAAYTQFLQRASQYSLLGSTCQAAYEAQEAGQAAAADPGTARGQKVERFRRSRALQGLIQQLEARQQRADEEVRQGKGR